MKTLLTLSMLFVVFASNAQNYAVGHTTVTFNDPNRTGGYGSGGGPGRQIQSEIYYPATVAGTDVNVASGAFPVIVFGHGFAMVWDAYANIWETIVPEGFIMVFPRTEGGLGPSHDEFGMDLALLADAMQLLNTDASSLLHNHITERTAIMGHSMGGGATMLASTNNTTITTIIGLAPAETTPSAIQAATNISVPSLIFSADEDAVTPATTHHQPIYDSIGADCKYFINIIGGGHCYYANPNFNCDFGENSSGGNISITRAEQQDIMFRYLLPWLHLYLNGACNYTTVFDTELLSDADVTFQQECTTIFPTIDNSVAQNEHVLTASMNNVNYQWLDCNNDYSPIPSETNQTFTAATNGNFAVALISPTCIDTSACYTVNTLSIAEEMLAITIQPNPSNGSFSINAPQDGFYNVYDVTGVLTATGKLQSGISQLNLDCAAGSYLMKFSFTNGSHYQKRIEIIR